MRGGVFQRPRPRGFACEFIISLVILNYYLLLFIDCCHCCHVCFCFIGVALLKDLFWKEFVEHFYPRRIDFSLCGLQLLIWMSSVDVELLFLRKSTTAGSVFFAETRNDI